MLWIPLLMLVHDNRSRGGDINSSGDGSNPAIWVDVLVPEAAPSWEYRTAGDERDSGVEVPNGSSPVLPSSSASSPLEDELSENISRHWKACGPRRMRVTDACLRGSCYISRAERYDRRHVKDLPARRMLSRLQLTRVGMSRGGAGLDLRLGTVAGTWCL